MKMIRTYLLLFLATGAPALHADSLCERQSLVYYTLLKTHFSPPAFNASVNEGVIDLFIQEADERHVFLLVSDRQEMIDMCSRVSAPELFCEILERSVQIVASRVRQLDSILLAIESRGLRFDGKDSIAFVPRRKKQVLSEDLPGLATRLERRLKYEVLQDLCVRELAGMERLLAEDLGLRQARAGEAAFRRFRMFLRPYSDKGYAAHTLADCMSRSIARRCDPHSSYFSRNDYLQYHAALSAEDNSFGFSAGADESGSVFVDEIAPGGPAARGGLRVGDRILAFSASDPVMQCIDSCGAEFFFRKMNEQLPETLRLEVLSGTIRTGTVVLTREHHPSRENALNGYILDVGGVRLGYIPVPSFYPGNDEDGIQGCAYDLAAEIVRLKSDSVKGILVDLRYNGGGSMREAIATAGIFIDHGPVAWYKPSDGNIFPLKDFHRGTVWEGPLAVLVNGGSASASEFFSAALQDHGRAVIVGSRTYGKGTAQSVLPADTNARENGVTGSSGGFLKVTAGKFYRVTGKGIQEKGIEPDVRVSGLPERSRETDQPYHLASDSIEVPPVTRAALPLEALRTQSAWRKASSHAYSRLSMLTDSVAGAGERTEKVALSVSAYREFSLRQQQLQDQLETLLGGSALRAEVSANRASRELIAISTVLRGMHESGVQSIKKDLVLGEAVSVLRDLVIYSAK